MKQPFIPKASFHLKCKTSHETLSENPYFLLGDDQQCDQKGGSLPLPRAEAFPQPPERSGSKTGNSRQIQGGANTLLTAVYWSKNLRGDESVYIQWSVAFLVYMQHNIYIIHTKLYTESHIPLSVFSSAGREMYRHWSFCSILYRRTVCSIPCPWY